MVKAGIVGLANVGKSTLFNSLLKRRVATAANYPFTTIEPNVGVVEVPDERLDKLAKVIAIDSSSATQNDRRLWVNGKPPIVPAVVEFVDIAGLVKGAHKGEGLGNQFLAHIREVDAIVFVVRDFKNADIVKTGDDPVSDLEILKTELLLKDLEAVNKVLKNPVKEKHSDNPNHQRIVLEKVKSLIDQGKWTGDELSSDELEKIADLQLLSSKKYLVVYNCDEEDLAKPIEIDGAIRISAKMEEELASLSEGEAREYLESVGVDEPGLNKLIKKGYELLGLMSFYTAGPKEVRAWTVARGSLASKAAGVIHGDFERGFIAADVVPFEKFVASGGWKGAREKGQVKTIGRSEVMPADVVTEFKFSV